MRGYPLRHMGLSRMPRCVNGGGPVVSQQHRGVSSSQVAARPPRPAKPAHSRARLAGTQSIIQGRNSTKNLPLQFPRWPHSLGGARATAKLKLCQTQALPLDWGLDDLTVVSNHREP
jgi:hypothetical protein